MSITGWRVHFTRRDLALPREVPPFMREFSALFAGLDQGLDDLGVPEGQPFLISPAGAYDVPLNRYFLGVAGIVTMEHPGRPCPGSAHVLRLPVVRARPA